MKLTAKAGLQIQKPITEVFEAIVNREHLTKYFISKSSGHLKTGEELFWEFGDFPGMFPIINIKTNPSGFISFV